MANEHSQIVPDMQPTSTVADFKFWCQKVLPLVYDDSLSYYEVLNKMVVFLNQVIDNINADTANVAELEADFLLLQTYVNTFFDDIDQLVTYAQRAEAAQTSASTSATNAASSASNAASSASNAASSASNAASSSISAMNARDAAVAAKTAAETALANAANSATAAAGSASDAAASAASADGAKAQAMIATSESTTTATATHNVGEYFRLNGVLYIATDDIAIGDTITVGTNCEQAILGDDVSELKSDFNTYVTKVYDTFSALVSDVANLEAGFNVRTNGYYSLNDGGGCVYKISSTSDRGGSIAIGSFFAVPVGDGLNTRQLGLQSGDNGQAIINAYIADTSYSTLYIVDDIHLKKTATGTAVDTIELVQIRRNDFTLVFKAGGKFTLETLNEDYYRMIAVEADNIVIVDPVLVGDADSIGITTGEYGHGLYIREGNNITVYNGNIGKCFGDAVSVSGGTSNVTFIGTLYCYECGRQGMSVAGCDGLNIDTIVGKDIVRITPGAVIDLEPNDTTNPIYANIKNIVGVDCKCGLCVAGGSEKIINVDTVRTTHTSNNYDCDVKITGTSTSGVDSKMEVVVNNVLVENAFKTVVVFGSMNDSAMVKLKNVLVNGMSKNLSNSTAEATISIGSGMKNVEMNIDVINNTSANPNLGVLATSSNQTYENVLITINDDCTKVVTDSLGWGTLINSSIINKPAADNKMFINSSDRVVYRTEPAPVYYQLRSYAHTLTVFNISASAFVLYNSGVSDYTLVDPDGIVTTTSSYWSIPASANIVSFTFDNTNKRLTVRKIA